MSAHRKGPGREHLDVDQLVGQFRLELPWHLRCSAKVAQISADHVRLYLNGQSDPFPACLDYAHVMAWLQHLMSTPPRRRNKARREASTVNGHLKSLKRLSKWAVARGFIERDEIGHLKGLPEADRVILAPEVEEVVKILQVAASHGSNAEIKARNHAIICALVDIGPRANEMVTMDVEDVSDELGNVRDYATIHGKGHKDRLVALNPLVKCGIEAYLRLRRPQGNEHALWLTESGQRMGYVAFRGIVQRITEKAGVKVALHDFRRFALSQMWAQGIDQINGMILSGHTNPHIYMRYIRGAMQRRALQEHGTHSPLAEALAGG